MKRFAVVLVACILAACSSSSEITETPDCPPADVADAVAITQERAQLIVGLKEKDAEQCAALLRWSFRVGSRDGEDFALTEDYSLQRVTVVVTKGIVTAISVG
jgi:hypothetical protein